MSERTPRLDSQRPDPGYPYREKALSHYSKYDVEFSAMDAPADRPVEIRMESDSAEG